MKDLSLERAFNYCLQGLSNYPCRKESGFVVGRAGLVLFLHQLAKTHSVQVDYVECMDKLIDEELSKDDYFFDLGYGLAGFCLALEWTNQMDRLYGQTDEIDGLFMQEYRLALAKNNLDYFKGASRYLFYFLMHKHGKDCLGQLIEQYVSRLEKNENGVDNHSHYFQDESPDKFINMGTPHGMTGILLLLLLAAEQGYTSIVSRPIQRCCKFLLNNRLPQGYRACFPSTVKPNGEMSDSGIAWCYGDLMAAYALLKAGILLAERSYTDFAYQVLTHSLQRTDYVRNDLCLCHGHSSLIVIYKAIYQLTNDNRFLKQSSFWNEKTKVVLNDKLEAARKGDENAILFLQNPSLLAGFPGCFLSLLSHNDANECKWSKFLLL